MGREIDECAAWLGPTLIVDLQHPCVVPGRATRPSLHPVAAWFDSSANNCCQHALSLWS